MFKAPDDPQPVDFSSAAEVAESEPKGREAIKALIKADSVLNSQFSAHGSSEQLIDAFTDFVWDNMVHRWPHYERSEMAKDFAAGDLQRFVDYFGYNFGDAKTTSDVLKYWLNSFPALLEKKRDESLSRNRRLADRATSADKAELEAARVLAEQAALVAAAVKEVSDT